MPGRLFTGASFLSKAEILGQIKEAEFDAAAALEAARQEREERLAAARQQARELLEREARAAKEEGAGRLAAAQAEIETAKQGLLKQGRHGVQRLQQDCEQRVEASADRFVQLFVEGRDA